MELKSVLGKRDVFALAFGAIIGWGWVVLSGALIDRGGTIGSMLAVLAGAVMVGFVGLTYAELTSAMPRAGGELAFTYRALGPTWSWLCGWSLILAYVGVCAFEAVALATVFGYLFPGSQAVRMYAVAGSDVYLSWAALGVFFVLFIGVINWVGVKTSARLQMAALAALTVVGVGFFAGGLTLGSSANLVPHFTSAGGFLHAAVLMPFLFVGFDVIPQVAEETNIPAGSIGRIILLSIGLAALWYMLVQISVGMGLPPAAHAESQLPTADAARNLFGSPVAAHILIFGGFLGILTSWNSFFVGGTRLLFGMGRAGMLPPFFARLHPKYQTPTGAILFVTVLSLAAPFTGRNALVWLADAAGLAVVIAYFMVAISFIMLRNREPELARPYRVRQWRVVGYGSAVVTMIFVLLYMPFSPAALIWPYEWAIVIGWAAMGMVAYALVKRLPAMERKQQEHIIFGEYARGVAKPSVIPGD